MSSECDVGASEIGGNEFICSIAGCLKSFRRRDRLRNHVAACHDGKNPFCCTHDGCDKSYSSPGGLKRHVNNVHSEKKNSALKIRCTVENCDATFTCKDNLKKHLKRIHEGRQLKCSHCAKAFIKRQQLKIHEFQHTGVKPFICSFEGCEKDFLLPSKLKVHMKVHNGYKCSSDGCDLSFATWSLQQKHMKQNHVVDHKCSICNKSFANKKNLRNHLPMHNDKREIFNCPKEGCSSFYHYEMNLKQHIRAKHEGKKFECSYEGCNMQFKHKCTLAKHLKVHDPLNSLDDKPKPRRKCLKRRSTAAKLSRYKATREEEIAVMYPEKCLPEEKVPAVVVMSSDPDLATEPEQYNGVESEDVKSKANDNDGNVIKNDENLKNLANDNNVNEIQSFVCKVAS